jgi:hypothetical protein
MPETADEEKLPPALGGTELWVSWALAVLWARHDPLYSPPKPGRGNKILWVSRVPLSAPGNLEIAARRLVGGRAVGAVVHRAVIGGPGPSLVDMPTAGCWQFSLRWSGQRDSVDLTYTGAGM